MLFKTFYAGGLGEDRDFETVIQAEKDIGEIWVELAENGYYVGYIMNEREFYVMFIVPTPYEEVIWKMLQLGLLFALYYPDAPNSRYASPNCYLR